MATVKNVQVSKKTYEYLDAQSRARGLSIERALEQVVQEFEKSREREFIERLRAEGMIVTFPPSKLKMPRNFKPVPVKGKPVSQTIIEDREPK